MKAKNGIESLVLAGIQGIGTVVIYLWDYNWPQTMAVAQAIAFVMLVAIGILLMRLLWICISSYVINVSKYLYYKITKEDIVTACFWPLFWTNKKWSWANVFWVYDDRTCFSMNKYLQDKLGFQKLCAYILKRNRVLFVIYLLVLAAVEYMLFQMKLYALMWLIVIGGVEHIVYQMEYRHIGTPNAMAFAGIGGVTTRLILHILVNQSKVESLVVGKEVVKILSEEMYDADGGYFFNYLCLSAMYNEMCHGVENEFTSYMDIKVENIINETPDAMKLIDGMEKQFKYKYIEPSICLFFVNYREFLLYVLMYYKLKNKQMQYIWLNNYIQCMLEQVGKECVHNSILSEKILENKFEEYKDLYQKVLQHEFREETTIFTGYDTLPLWKEARHEFVRRYNNELGK